MYRLAPMRVWTFRGNTAGLHRRSVCASACVPNMDRRKLDGQCNTVQCAVWSVEGTKATRLLLLLLWVAARLCLSLFLKATTCAVLCLLSPHSTRGLVVETRTLGDTDSRLHCEIFFLCSFPFFFPLALFLFFFS